MAPEFHAAAAISGGEAVRCIVASSGRGRNP